VSRLALSCVAVALLAQTAAAEGEHDKRRRDRLATLLVGAGIYVATESVLKGTLSPDTCRWCGTNRVDRAARDAFLWDDIDQARSASHATGYVLAPVAAFSLLAIAGSSDDRPFLRFVDDAIPVLEAVVYTQLFTQIMKFSTARERPGVHFTDEKATNEANLSFISGHSSLAFSLATAAGMVAHRRKSPFEPIIWGTGMALATATGYLRIAGDKHYLTDVLAGAAAGIVGGIFIPIFSDSLPRGPGKRTRLVPAGNGIALSGVF
jgi:hypothetical protein